MADKKEDLVGKAYFEQKMKEDDKNYSWDWIEQSRDQMVKTDYLKPVKRFTLVHQTFAKDIEEIYFWMLNHVRDSASFPIVEKTMDIFTASELSAFFGVQQQRLGLQQDKVQQFLATVGKMIKDMFQLVRELRILDERLHYYNDSLDYHSKTRESAEITLKGIYVDQVEGASKSPASVYGMAQQLGFTTLPDLFFASHPYTIEDIDPMVDKMEFNRKVKEVLKRKLRSFMEWKLHTKK